MKKQIIKTTIKTITLGAMALNISCGKTEGGSDAATVRLTMGDQSTFQSKVLNMILPEAYAAEVGNIRFCFKRLRFKLPHAVLTENTSDESTDDSNSRSGDDNLNDGVVIVDDSTLQSSRSGEDSVGSDDNVDFHLGEVTIDPQGTDLGAVTLPAGEYVRIEFDLDNDCVNGNSVQLSNASGDFSSQDNVKIRFDGNFNVVEGAEINLPLAQIVSALESFTTSSNNQKDISRQVGEALENLSIKVSDDSDDDQQQDDRKR